MYDYLSGRLTVRKPNYVVIDVGGAGYRVEIPLSTYQRLPRDGEVKLHTWLKVAEDDMRLYGFATEGEREIFLRMIDGVPQFGPARALAILSNLGVDELLRAVEEGDADRLQRVRGIGPKIASRIVLELKGKLPESAAGAGAKGGEPSISRDVVQALVSLGYGRSEAEEGVRRARREMQGEVSVEELLRKCLASL